MDASRFARVREIFHAALGAHGDERATILDQACGDDSELRAEVDALLAADNRDTGSFLPGRGAKIVPTSIDGYAIERELGRGGMGTVYLARAPETGRRVALKLLHPWLHVATSGLARFRQEAEAGLAIRNEHVVRTLALSPVDRQGEQYLVMEYVEGRTLRELLESIGRVPEQLLREITRQIARGLRAIHGAGLLHRDLKPENVMITNDQRVRIMDLGIAKMQERSVALTQEGQFVGSLAYAAPEQFEGAPVDERSDLYSLGVVLYELASGSNPFRHDEPFAALARAPGATPGAARRRRTRHVAVFFRGGRCPPRERPRGPHRNRRRARTHRGRCRGRDLVATQTARTRTTPFIRLGSARLGVRRARRGARGAAARVDARGRGRRRGRAHRGRSRQRQDATPE